jgi:hypothetical protein
MDVKKVIYVWAVKPAVGERRESRFISYTTIPNFKGNTSGTGSSFILAETFKTFLKAGYSFIFDRDLEGNVSKLNAAYRAYFKGLEMAHGTA